MIGPSVAEIGAELRRLGLDRLDAQLILAHVLVRPRTWLLAHDDDVLDLEEAARMRSLGERRVRGEPLAYLVGTKEFHGLLLEVDARVLVPRPETELLVDRAVDLLDAPCQAEGRPRVLDLGTGSGAIALAVKAALPDAAVFASDESGGALAVAAANAARLQLEIELRLGSWWQPWAGERFDLVLANPPYVAAADPHLAALRHEPEGALVGGVDGLDDLRLIVDDAAEHLRQGGSIWLEHGHGQAERVRSLLYQAGFEAIETRADLAGLPRCSGGRL